jgi:hypothetical protein
MNFNLSNVWPNDLQLELLRAGLFSGHFSLDAWQKWKEGIDFDKIDYASYKLLPLVARNESLRFLQDPVFDKCKGVYRRNWVENQLSWNKLLPVLEALHNFGVDKIILLKGMAMTLHVYKDFGTRVMGDVDILIRKDQVRIAIPFLLSSGWKPTVAHFDVDDEEQLKRAHAINLIHRNGLKLDVHWSFIEEHSLALDEAVLKGAIPLQSSYLYVPNPADLLLQTCVHGLKYSQVPLIRWIADAVSLLKHSQRRMDWNRFILLANQAHLCRPLYFGLNYLAEKFQAPIPQNVIDKFKSHPSTRLEELEYAFNMRKIPHLAAWFRFCLNQGYFSKKAQIMHIHQYLQLAARLKSPWQIPLYAIYWIFKRIYRLCLAVTARVVY